MQRRSPVTTHILDVSRGKPASGVPVKLEKWNVHAWEDMGISITNQDGRAEGLIAAATHFGTGIYRLTFDTNEYYKRQGLASFYPHVTISFCVESDQEHYHVPLLLSPFGYSTYRGS